MIIIRLKESDPTRAQDAEQNYVDPKWFIFDKRKLIQTSPVSAGCH